MRAYIIFLVMRAERIFLFALFLFSFLTIAYWLADNRLPVHQLANYAATTHVPPGGRLVIFSRVNRVRQCPARVERMIFDSAGHRYTQEPMLITRAGDLGLAEYRTTLRVSPEAVPGPAHVLFVIAWTCNAAQSLTGWPIVSTFRVQFEITQ